MNVFLFGLISTLAILAALGTVLARNLVHAALFLVGFFFLVACQFILLEAELIAAIQVMVYIGAIAVLMMFGIMLTRNIQGDETTRVVRAWRIPAGVASLGLFSLLVLGIYWQEGLNGSKGWSDQTSRPTVTTATVKGIENPTAIANAKRAAVIRNMGQAVGEQMLSRFLIPFEVAGLLLTAALVGAIALAVHDGAETEDPAEKTRIEVENETYPAGPLAEATPETAQVGA